MPREKSTSLLEVGDTVVYLGQVFEVIRNPFTDALALDNDFGQVSLSEVNDKEVTILRKGG